MIAIISLLSSVVLAALRDARDKANGTAFRQEVKQLINAIELNKADNEGKIVLGPNPNEVYNMGRLSNGNWIDTGGISEEDYFDTYLKKYILKFPVPPFAEINDNFGVISIYHASQIHDSSVQINTACSAGYVILIAGTNTLRYFSDWTEYSSNTSTLPPTEVTGQISWKCYSLE